MPIYEYACDKCGGTFEVLQKMSDRPLRKCRKCSGKLRKLVSRTSFQLKGGGWYAQGYSNSSSGGDSKPKTGKKNAGKSESDSGGKSESKPSGKPDASGSVATASGV